MTWIQKFSEAHTQGAYLGNKTSFICYINGKIVFLYKDGMENEYSLISIDNNGNKLSDAKTQIAPYFITNTNKYALILGINVYDDSLQYAIFDGKNISSYSINGEKNASMPYLPYHASSFQNNDKDIFSISYIDIEKNIDNIKNPIINFCIINDSGYIIKNVQTPLHGSSANDVYINGNKTKIFYLSHDDNTFKLVTCNETCEYENSFVINFQGKLNFLDAISNNDITYILYKFDKKLYYIFTFDRKSNSITNAFEIELEDKIRGMTHYENDMIAVLLSDAILLYDKNGRIAAHIKIEPTEFNPTCLTSPRRGEFVIGGFINSSETTFIPTVVKLATDK